MARASKAQPLQENDEKARKPKTKDQKSEKKQPRYLVTEADREGRPMTLDEMVSNERTITAFERINIVVEYACLGQDPKPEKYVGRPRYIKASRHGRTRLAKRSARRNDVPPPAEKMLVYDDEVAQRLYGDKHTSLRRLGDVLPEKDEPMEEDEHKEHSRDSGCPVSPPTDKDAADKKEDSGSSRGSVEKESRKRRSPDLLNDEPNAISGTSHFIVKGNTPLTAIRKLLEVKRQIPEELRLELIDASGKQILDENSTVAHLANERKWTRNGPLRILYTITRCLETEDAPVLDVQEPCTMQQPQKTEVSAATPAAAAHPPTTPSPQQLLYMQHMQHMQQQQMNGHPQQPPYPYHPHQMVLVKAEDGSKHMMPYSQLMMHHQQQQQQQQQDHEGLLKMSTPPGAPPPHHHFAGAPPTFGGMAPPPPGHHQQHQMAPTSIFPPGHVIVEHGNGSSQLVAANMSVESVISNAASIKKRQRMAPKRTQARDELMARRGIEKGATIVGKGAKMGLPFQIGSLPGISSIRMPHGFDPSIMANLSSDPRNMKELPIEAITIDGVSHSIKLGELPALAAAVSARVAAAAATASASSAAAAAPPASMLTPDERMLETISTVRTKAVAMHEEIARRASSEASSASAAEAADEAAPRLAAEAADQEEEADEAPPRLSAAPSPPPDLYAPETPDSSPSLEIDETIEEDRPLPPPALKA